MDLRSMDEFVDCLLPYPGFWIGFLNVSCVVLGNDFSSDDPCPSKSREDLPQYSFVCLPHI